MTIKEKDFTASLAAMSAFLGIFESFIPSPVPFLRLGLANIPVCLSLPFLPIKNILFIVCFKLLFTEANAIIAAARERMLGATLYMVCVDAKSGELVSGTTSCMMCKRMVINAGISQVIVRDDAENFRIIDVQSWIDDDDSLSGIFGY